MLRKIVIQHNGVINLLPSEVYFAPNLAIGLQLNISSLWALDSTGRRNTCVKPFRWGFVSQRFSRPLIELSGNSTELCLTMYRQIRALWEVLSQQPVGILIRAPLPWRVWITQEDVDIRG